MMQSLPSLRIGILGSDCMKTGLVLKLYEPLSPPPNQLQIHTVSYHYVSQISLFLKMKVTPDHQPLPVTSTFYKLLFAKLSNLKLNLAMLLLIQTGGYLLYFLSNGTSIYKRSPRNDGISLLIEKQFTSTTSNDSDVYL